jgi:HSP20 family protein
MLVPEFRRFGFEPFADMWRLQDEMNRVFGDVGLGMRAEYPPVNLWLGEQSVALTAAVPGLDASDVELTVREDTVTIRGQRKPEAAAERVTYHRRERPQGSFSRTIRLPFRIDTSRVEAHFTDGLLEVELQRPKEDLPRKIDIKTA